MSSSSSGNQDENGNGRSLIKLLEKAGNSAVTKRAEATIQTTSELSFIPWVIKTKDSKNETEFPDYLHLRKVQNEAFASKQLQKGVALAKSGRPNEAEQSYQKGLELIPNHAELLVAYGALCANQGRTNEAKLKLNAALQANPNCANAREYLQAVQDREHAALSQPIARESTKRNNTLARNDKALQDAMAEQAFMGGSNVIVPGISNEMYPLIQAEVEQEDDSADEDSKDDNSPSESEHRKRKRRKRKKERRKHKSRRKHSRQHSDGDRRKRKKKDGQGQSDS